MNKLEQSSVGKLVGLTFGTLCGLLLVIGGLFYFSLQAIERNNQLQQSRALDKLALIDDTGQDVGQIQADILRQILANNDGEIRQLDQTIRDVEKTNLKELIDYQQFVDTPQEKQLYAKLMQTRKAYWDQALAVMALSNVNKDSEAMALVNAKQAPAYDGFIKALNALITQVEADAAETARTTSRFISRIRIMGNALVGLTILIIIATGFAVVAVGRRLKQDNQELRSKTAFLEAQVNSSIDGVLVIDQEQKLALQNERFIDLFKIPRHIAEEKGDQNRLRWVADMVKDPALFIEKITHLYAHPNEVSSDEIELKDGTMLDRYSAPVIGRDGKYYGRIWTFRDVTMRKRLEAQMIQAQRMETVGKLAGGVAHEFNSILTAIIGQSEMILSDLPPDSPLCKKAEEIRRAAERAAGLTWQLLAYGRKQLLQPANIDLNVILNGMESTLRHLVGVDVDVRILPGPGLKAVKMDPSLMEQVIVNIAMNAAAAMPNGGKLTLETANATLDQDYVSHFPELKAGEYVMLAITDTGPGISPEVKKHLFEPFFSTKDVGQGTGLGLATCYGIVKQSGGHINVYSELSRGASFKVYLPQAGARATAPAPPAAASELPRGTETIMLVEDDPALLEMSSSLLAKLGYTIFTARDGLEALNLKHQRESRHVDLVFTDVVMPHMSGKEFADRFRALYPRTKILFTSAYTENSIVHQGALDPGVTLLQKPFTPSALAAKVREMLDMQTV